MTNREHTEAPAPRGMEAVDLQALREKQLEHRERERAIFRGQETLALNTIYEEAWEGRNKASRVISAVSEELLARKVKAIFPTATLIVLFEDTSHDTAHGHLESILDTNYEVLALGVSDAWHEADWSHELDEHVWDLFQLDREGFVTDPDGVRRRTIAI